MSRVGTGTLLSFFGIFIFSMRLFTRRTLLTTLSGAMATLALAEIYDRITFAAQM